jgi:hypothetical protein
MANRSSVRGTGDRNRNRSRERLSSPPTHPYAHGYGSSLGRHWDDRRSPYGGRRSRSPSYRPSYPSYPTGPRREVLDLPPIRITPVPPRSRHREQELALPYGPSLAASPRREWEMNDVAKRASECPREVKKELVEAALPPAPVAAAVTLPNLPLPPTNALPPVPCKASTHPITAPSDTAKESDGGLEAILKPKPANQPSQSVITMTIRGASFEYNLERDLAEQPEGVITLLRHGTCRANWMMVGAHYRRKGNLASAERVVKAFIDCKHLIDYTLRG